MIAKLSAEDQVRALCQLCGFSVNIDSDDHIPITIQLAMGADAMMGTDDCAGDRRIQQLAWNHFCYRSWESALKGIATFTPASS